MTAWTTITNALVAVGAKPFATTMQALRDNPVAISEGASGSPVLSAAWHPNDMINVGDGATGKIYDASIDGALASVTANFATGYDYLIRLSTVTGSLSLTEFQIGGANTVLDSGISPITGIIKILAPRSTNMPKTAFADIRQVVGSSAVKDVNSANASPFLGFIALNSMASGLSTLALSYSSGNINGGEIYLYRRRNFMFG
jgi:hypothetical protein